MDPDLLLASQDYKKLERTHLKVSRSVLVYTNEYIPFQEGFREGVEGGKDAVMNKGFRSGFRDGLKASVRWARLKGRLR